MEWTNGEGVVNSLSYVIKEAGFENYLTDFDETILESTRENLFPFNQTNFSELVHN